MVREKVKIKEIHEVVEEYICDLCEKECTDNFQRILFMTPFISKYYNMCQDCVNGMIKKFKE